MGRSTKAATFPAVVPPPPPGFLAGSDKPNPLTREAQTFAAIVPPPPQGFLGSVSTAPGKGRSLSIKQHASQTKTPSEQRLMAMAGLSLWRAAWRPEDIGSEAADAQTVSREFQAPGDPRPMPAALVPHRSQVAAVPRPCKDEDATTCSTCSETATIRSASISDESSMGLDASWTSNVGAVGAWAQRVFRRSYPQAQGLTRLQAGPHLAVL